jgi:hypothetical protein
MMKCVYLKEWLIASCSAGDIPFVIMPFVVEEYCTSGKSHICPLQAKAGESALCNAANP